MNKIKVNNEIILLRKDVEQARVVVTNKLTRNINKLRNNKGTEDQKAKNEKKAQKLANEILSIKKVKKDEITKFALNNTLTLNKILENINSDSLTRIMARIAHHKKFMDKISAFKKKYPDYAEFLGPGRRKKQKQEKKNKKLEKSASVKKDTSTKLMETSSISNKSSVNSIDPSESVCDESDNSECQKNTKDLNETSNNKENKTDIISENSFENSSEDDGEKNTDFLSNKIIKKKCSKEDESNLKTENNKTKQKKLDKQILEKKIEDDKKLLTVSKSKDSSKIITAKKTINKEVVVKKFADILNDDDDDDDDTVNTHENKEKNDNIKQNTVEKEVDLFFLTEDGDTNYLSIAVPKSTKNNITNDSDDDSNFRNHTGNKNFINISKSRNDNFKRNNRSDSKWENQHEDFYPNKKQKTKNKTFEKFNEGNRSKSKLDKSQTSYNDDNKSNEILHPSWEAKRKQQEMIKQGFQGKKIVFGDDV